MRFSRRDSLFLYIAPQHFPNTCFNSARKDSGCPIVGFKTRSSPLKLRGTWMMKNKSVFLILLLSGCVRDNVLVTHVANCPQVPSTGSSGLCCHPFLCVWTSTVPKSLEQERRGEVVNDAAFSSISIFSAHDPKAWNSKQRRICLARGSNSL